MDVEVRSEKLVPPSKVGSKPALESANLTVLEVELEPLAFDRRELPSRVALEEFFGVETHDGHASSSMVSSSSASVGSP
jgi:hypothetical protein